MKRSEKELELLYFANRETTKVAMMIFLLALCIYCIYAVFTNEN